MRQIACVAALAAALFLAACGGGGGSQPTVQPPPTADPAPRPKNLEYPLAAWSGQWYDADANITWYPAAFGTQHYGTAELPRQDAEDARRAPIYHDSGHYGGLGLEAPERRLFVGVDQTLSHDGTLPVIVHWGPFDIRHGQVSDGVGAAVLAEYIRSAEGNRRCTSPPTVRGGPDRKRPRTVLTASYGRFRS